MRQQKRVYWLIVNPRGQTMTEYAMILVTVAAICVALVGSGGTIISALVNRVGPLL
jgi:Flp pilus assembly pilin Flp